MGIGFGDAVLIFGGLLTVVAALSGVMKGTVLSASVLSVALGIALAAFGVVDVDPTSESIVELVELALILTLFSDGMFVERELLQPALEPGGAGAGDRDADHDGACSASPPRRSSPT